MACLVNWCEMAVGGLAAVILTWMSHMFKNFLNGTPVQEFGEVKR